MLETVVGDGAHALGDGLVLQVEVFDAGVDDIDRASRCCEKLDQTATTFPGSRLRIRFSVHPPPRTGLAFPGSPGERSTTTTVVAAS
jgi:hypothetical protein